MERYLRSPFESAAPEATRASRRRRHRFGEIDRFEIRLAGCSITHRASIPQAIKRGASLEESPSPGVCGLGSRATVVSDDDVVRFVERTTTASGVPFLVEDDAAIDHVARVL